MGVEALTLRPHSAADYTALDDIDEPGVGDLSDADQRCLDELGAFLVDRKANERFGIGLLHRHFAVGDDEAMDDEAMVEHVDAVSRSMSLRPLRATAPTLGASSAQLRPGPPTT